MVKVKKVAVVGRIESLKRIVTKLAQLGWVEIEKYEGSLRSFPSFEEKGKLSDLVVRIRSILDVLQHFFHGKVEKVKALPMRKAIEEASKLVEELEKEVIELSHRRKSIEREYKALTENIALLKRLSPDLDLGIFESESICLFTGKVLKTQLTELKESIREKVPHAMIISQPLEGGWNFLIVASLREDEEALSKILERFRFIGINLPKAKGTVSEVLDEMEKRLIKLRKEREKTEKRLRELAKKVPRLLQLLEMLENYLRLVEGAERAGVSERFFVLTLWIPEAKLKELEKALREIDDSTQIFELEFNEEEAPVIYSAPSFLKPFYSILSLVGPPSPETIDPLISISFFFPLFFGMMLGDIGYGLLLLIFSTIFRDRVNKLFKSVLGKEFGNFSFVLLIASISSIFFGLLFGEFFGNLGHFIGIKPLLFDRLENVKTLLLASAAAGILHLNLGILFSLLAELRFDKRRAILGKGAWFLLQVSALLLWLKQGIGAILLAVSLYLLARYEGMGGILEIPSFVGNIFSYMRLAAIGLSSAGIAIAINLLSKLAFNLNPVLGALVFISGHSLNFLLGILDPFIQATRLHLVEFFSKFYEPARRVFIPFVLKRNYTGGGEVWN